ncbi:DUF4376 domain-containing protein [Burkholderia multivorans]|uniref:DUF4376 domain-containing protein n=1 Tax=Burkholderia multivorans TaxID=87883 RepID=UPI000CFE9BA1|nr:DUF4376 domain-containing protein [Burkholderia multivorans]MBU9403579.1 DUF4376 domain-containing protein [Burkholderia multivorans]PRH21921.1 hypothetical protein C6T71_19670 [Burkholderia multivorans]
MTYTIEFDSTGKPVCSSMYGPGSAPDPLPAGEIVCTADEYAAWQRCAYREGTVTLIEPTADELLVDEQCAQVELVTASYEQAIYEPVTFTTQAGVEKVFDADGDSQSILMQATQGYTLAQKVPDNFYWKAADNTLVPFALSDLQGLYQTMLAQGWSAFQKLQSLKTEIAAATTVAAVQSITW